MILVVDASSLITLARIGRLHLLHDLTESLCIPQAVYDEVVIKGEGRPGSKEIAQVTWISREQVDDQLAVARLRADVGRGEAEAIVLAGELGADFVILDDAKARQVAEAEGRRVLGLLGLLIRAKGRGLIETLKPILDEMIAVGFFIDAARYRSVLRHVGEEDLLVGG